MTGRLPTVFLWALVATLVAGCATTTPTRFYTLSATAAAEPAALPPTSFSVGVGPVRMPEVLDRPQMVLRAGANRVTIDEFNCWASPLPTNAARVVAENLVRLLGTPRVTLYPQGPTLNPDYRVEIDFLRFESAPGEAATIEALWTARRTSDGRARTARTELREVPSEAGIDGVVAAHSRALGRLSEDVAGAIRALESSGKR